MKKLFWLVWESRIPEFIRVYLAYLKCDSSAYTKIKPIPFIPIAWRYAKMGYMERVRIRLAGEGRRAARFCVSMELLRDALAMPDDTLIYNITPHPSWPNIFVFYVEHPDLPVSEDATPPEINPDITADYEKRPSSWLTWDWGLQNAGEDQ